MADYKAPLRDMRFVLNEVFEVAKLWAELPALAETVDAQTVEAILEEAGKVTGKSIAPLSRSADEEGCHWSNGAVTTPQGFTQAYQTYAEGGWVGVGGDERVQGHGIGLSIVQDLIKDYRGELPGKPIHAQHEVQPKAGQPHEFFADHATVGDLGVEQGALNGADQGHKAGQQGFGITCIVRQQGRQTATYERQKQ